MKALFLLPFIALCLADTDAAADAAAAAADVEEDEPVKRGPPPPPATAEKQEFQTDVRKMLDIIINSLYTNRNIFLRELISNSADALDKVRFLYLTQPRSPKNDAGEEPTMDIRITMDKDEHTLTIRDGGIGMTREELVNNLGKIGSSGTKQFLEKFQQAQGDINLIGQFGVGFYSAFLVADRIVVASKNDDSPKQVVWESSADGEYLVYDDPRGNTLGRGTEIKLYLKEDADEFAEEGRVREIATRYSEFIHFPIYVWARYDPSRHPKDEKADKADKGDDAEKKEGEEGEEAEAEAEAEEEAKPEMEWLRLNEVQPIWMRTASEVTDEEYKKFFKALTKDFDEPLVWDHFTAEGEVNFKSILYIPSRAPAKLFEGTQSVVSNIKLYVRRVFITDEFKDMLPRYLSFVAGVVDSDDLPLNVSREILQENRVLKIIKKKLIRKILGMVKDIADKDDDAMAKYNEQVEAAESEEAKSAIEKPTLKYSKFYEEYGKALRLGLIDDAANRARLSKLLRYHTTKTDKDEWRSLEQYVEGMQEKQTEIYYIIGFDNDVEELAKKPFIQKFKKVGVEVILMTDPIDEYVVGHMTEFAGKKLVNLAKEDVKVPGEDEDARKTFERRKTLNKDFTDWYKNVLGRNVEKVVLSERLHEAPAVVVSSKYGLTANMYNIMKGTPLGEQAQARSPLQKVLEVNINHPVIRKLRDESREHPDDQKVKDAATLIFETALFESGFVLEDMKSFVSRMQSSVGASLGVESFDVLADEELPPEEVETPEEEEEVDADAADEGAAEGGDHTMEIDLSQTATADADEL